MFRWPLPDEVYSAKVLEADSAPKKRNCHEYISFENAVSSFVLLKLCQDTTQRSLLESDPHAKF